MWITAKRLGECAEGCSNRIDVGDRIVYANGHAFCGDCGTDMEGEDPQSAPSVSELSSQARQTLKNRKGKSKQ